VIEIQQRVNSCNVVNWIQKIVFHRTCHGQLKPLTVVIKYRLFMFVEKEDDDPVNTVGLFIYL